MGAIFIFFFVLLCRRLGYHISYYFGWSCDVTMSIYLTYLLMNRLWKSERRRSCVVLATLHFQTRQTR